MGNGGKEDGTAGDGEEDGGDGAGVVGEAWKNMVGKGTIAKKIHGAGKISAPKPTRVQKTKAQGKKRKATADESDEDTVSKVEDYKVKLPKVEFVVHAYCPKSRALQIGDRRIPLRQKWFQDENHDYG